jgi:DNA repair protein RecO (recombination protein O)
MQQLKTQALILAKNNRGESDALISFYTPKYGKLEAVIKAAKKLGSKLNGHTEPLSISELMLAKGANFWRVAGASLVKDFVVKNNLATLQAAQYLVLVTNQLIKVEHAENKIFFLLQKTLELLEKKLAPEKIIILASAHVFKLLAFLGYKPDLINCLKCKTKIKPEKVIFSAVAGGLVCQPCQKVVKSGEIVISVATVKVLRLYFKQSLEQILQLKLTKIQAQEVFSVVNIFLQTHLDKEIKGLKNLQRLF